MRAQGLGGIRDREGSQDRPGVGLSGAGSRLISARARRRFAQSQTCKRREMPAAQWAPAGPTGSATALAPINWKDCEIAHSPAARSKAMVRVSSKKGAIIWLNNKSLDIHS
jgi:hypothetical protein